MLRYILIILTIIAVFNGCSTLSKQGELERVAKDWSMTIRASQIIPVYPLTEDLQPADGRRRRDVHKIISFLR